MDIERAVLEGDLEDAMRDVREYRSRVAVARVGVSAMLEAYGPSPRNFRLRADLRRLADILDGRLTNVNGFKHSDSQA